ncbi:MAG: MFS transporter [Clostridia bacterium]|nr:MFS transporter [Clostridia bacterium]
MVKAVFERASRVEKDFLLFVLAGMFIGIGQSVDGSTLNNFLKENFHMAIVQRSMLEIPREMPGFLVFLIVGFLYALGDIRIAVLANLTAGLGMFLLGIIPPNYAIMLMCIFVYSSGQHVFMPLFNSIGMSFANDGRLGRKLGQINAANTAALVASSAILWLLFRYLRISYTVSFTIGAIAFAAAGIVMMLMQPKNSRGIKGRFVFRKKYSLFYWFSVLYGARKQIFLTFGPWVLVDVFRQKVTTMTILFFTIAFLSIFVKPLTGRLIDGLGERLVLAGESALLVFVCLGYVFADRLSGNGPVIIVSACYIIDQLMNSAAMARATYLKKIAVCEEDVSPTLSAGISIDHIVSMFLPTLGGIIWHSNGSAGYKYVFLGGAIIALVNFFSALRIRIRHATPITET